MTPPACRTTRGMLSAHLDADLAPEYEAAVRAHLAGCAACRGELELLRLTVGALRSLPELPAPAGILAGVRAGIAPAPRPVGFFRRLGRGWLVGVPVGAIASLLVVLGVVFFQERYPELKRQVGAPVAPPPPAPPPATPAATPPLAAPLGATAVGADAPGATGAKGDTAAREVKDVPPAKAIAGRPRAATPALPPAPREPQVAATAPAAAPPAPAAPPPPAAESLQESAAFRAAERTAPAPEGVADGTRFVIPEQEPRVASRPAYRFDGEREEQRYEAERSADERRVGRASSSVAPAPRLAGIPPSPAPAPAAGASRAAGESAGLQRRTAGRYADRGAAGRNGFPEEVVAREGAGERSRVAGALGDAVAKKKESGAREPIEVLYVLTRDGEEIEELRRIIKREGGSLLEVRALDPEGRRDAMIPLQGQLPAARRITRGWLIEAKVPRRNFPRFLDSVKRGAGYELLQRNPAEERSGKDPEQQKIRINLFR